MNYLPRNRSRSSFAKPVLILLGIFVIGWIIFYFLSGVILSVISPVWKMENAATAKLSGIGDFFRSRNSLAAENASLRERVSSLELEMAARFSLPAEGGELSTIIGRRAETGGIVAAALATPPQTPYDTIVIDAGSSEGVAKGMRVFMPDGPVLGMVTEVYAGTTKVKLYSSSGERTNAVLERYSVPVVLEGLGGGNFKITLAREVEVAAGDRILSADVFSHLLGIVGDVKVEPTNSFKEVRVVSPANVFEIHLVLVRQ